MLTIGRKAEPARGAGQGPYIVCALQECRRMNVLIGEIGRTLMELEKGLGGQLNMTQAMEDLCSAFLINQWPGRNPFALAAWTEELVTPISVWLSGLFNPMAYLTGVTQAVPVQVTWEPSAVGYLRHVDDIYECPVFITTMRGPTYIFLATLKTAEPKSKWTLTGTALMMQTDD
ncbi:hypothetical protein JL721_3358 [Aureococcus anophagefferens]|nr:hypothetical protein JL721_3358 [Aureococcus anophagefferens]